MQKKSYKEIIVFLNTANAWLAQNPKEGKFRYAVKKMVKRLESTADAYNEKTLDLSIENCSVDKDGLILKDAKGGYEFTKEQARKLATDRKALLAVVVDVDPYYAQELPEGLSEEIQEVFEGFVIPALIEVGA